MKTKNPSKAAVLAAERQDDLDALTLLLLAESYQECRREIERFSIDEREDVVDTLVDIASGGIIRGNSCAPDTRQRAAMAVCRILAIQPLHLPERCERCDLPLRGPLEVPHASTHCRCSKSKSKR